MKKSIFITIILLIMLSACGHSDNHSTIVETIQVKYISKSGAYNSDVEIYLDGEVIGKLKAGNSGSYTVTLSSGNHKIWAKEKSLLHANYKSNKVQFQADSYGNSFNLEPGAIKRLKLTDITTYESTDAAIPSASDTSSKSTFDIESNSTIVSNNSDDHQNTAIESNSYSEPFIKAGTYHSLDGTSELIDIGIWNEKDNPIGVLITYDIFLDNGGYHNLDYVTEHKYVLSDNESITLEFNYKDDEAIPIYTGTDSNIMSGTLDGYHTVTIYMQGNILGTYKQANVIVNE